MNDIFKVFNECTRKFLAEWSDVTMEHVQDPEWRQRFDQKYPHQEPTQEQKELLWRLLNFGP